jgi:hypothetical protein
MADEIDIDVRTARALGLTRFDRTAVADRLAEIGELRTPSWAETEEFLVAVLSYALGEIPSSGAAWSWGEFHNGGLQPIYDMTREKDWPRLAVCAADLGLDGQPPTTKDGETLTPRDGLSRNLIEATERLLQVVRRRLETAGVTPYGPSTTPPSS